MKKFISCLLILLTVSLSLTVSANPAATDVKVVGENGAVFYGNLYNGVTYVPVKEYCESMSPYVVNYNASTRTTTVTSRAVDLKVTAGSPYFEANGRYFYLAQPAALIDGKMMMPIRAISQAFCVDVLWHQDTLSATLKSNGQTLVHGNDFYQEDAVYWLSRIISSESKGEVFEGQVAVGNVVLNRVKSTEFPNTIYSVIFDRNYGVQFTPVANGTIYDKPADISVIAAKICLEGVDMLPGALYFLNPRIATNTWIPQNRPYIADIGLHSFYK